MFKSTVLLVVCLIPSMASAQWYGAVDFMVPTRSVTDGNVFQRNQVLVEVPPPVVTTPPTPSTFVDTVGTESRLSLDMDFVAGGRAMVGYQAEAYGVQGSFLATDQWNAMASVSDAGGMLTSPFSLPGSHVNPLVDSNTFASVAYQTKLESAELNLTYLSQYQSGEGMWKLGVRALWLDEAFQYNSTNAVMSNTLLSNTTNRIIGPQIGFRGQTWAPGGSIALSVSGMLGYNDIGRTSVFNGATTVTNTGEASLVGDASIEYLFAPHPNVFVRVGYQILGVGSVALAPNDPMISNGGTEGVAYSLPYVGVVVVR